MCVATGAAGKTGPAGDSTAKRLILAPRWWLAIWSQASWAGVGWCFGRSGSCRRAERSSWCCTCKALGDRRAGLPELSERTGSRRDYAVHRLHEQRHHTGSRETSWRVWETEGVAGGRSKHHKHGETNVQSRDTPASMGIDVSRRMRRDLGAAARRSECHPTQIKMQPSRQRRLQMQQPDHGCAFRIRPPPAARLDSPSRLPQTLPRRALIASRRRPDQLKR
jgi:hypothetical protein